MTFADSSSFLYDNDIFPASNPALDFPASNPALDADGLAFVGNGVTINIFGGLEASPDCGATTSAPNSYSFCSSDGQTIDLQTSDASASFVVTTPEPAPIAGLGTALAFLVGLRRRGRKAVAGGCRSR